MATELCNFTFDCLTDPSNEVLPYALILKTLECNGQSASSGNCLTKTFTCWCQVVISRPMMRIPNMDLCISMIKNSSTPYYTMTQTHNDHTTHLNVRR